MKVAFENVESALFYGAPNFEEQQAILALDRNDVLTAEVILDQVIANNPDRVRNIYMYREEGVAYALMHKYIVQTAAPAQNNQAKTPFISRVKASDNSAAPPPYKDNDPTSVTRTISRDSNGEYSTRVDDTIPIPNPVKDKPENRIRHRKTGLSPEKWVKDAKK